VSGFCIVVRERAVMSRDRESTSSSFRKLLTFSLVLGQRSGTFDLVDFQNVENVSGSRRRVSSRDVSPYESEGGGRRRDILQHRELKMRQFQVGNQLIVYERELTQDRGVSALGLFRRISSPAPVATHSSLQRTVIGIIRNNRDLSDKTG
jgi:hypothetical protein